MHTVDASKLSRVLPGLVRRAAPAALLLASGCYHWGEVSPIRYTHASFREDRVRVRTADAEIELADVTVAPPSMRGRFVELRQGSLPVPQLVPARGAAFNLDLTSARSVQRYELNQTVVAVVSTAVAVTIVGGLGLGIAAGSAGGFGGGGFGGGGAGRRPAGLAPFDSEPEGDALGRCFAEMAELEAASVPAFEHLARELTEHGAPKRLVRASVTAASDERRHARMMGRLAWRFGGRPRAVRVTPMPVRPLDALAVENAVEGCVGETWGALQAHWQAGASSDRAVRAVARRIAADETRHAALAWRVDEWARSRLDASAIGRVRDARDEAVSTLARAVSEGGEGAHERVVGLPRGLDAARLFSLARAELWAPGGA